MKNSENVIDWFKKIESKNKYDIAEFYCLWKKKDGDGCFDVSIWSYDGAQLYEFIGTYLVSQLRTIIKKNACGIYRKDGLIIQEYINDQ